MCGCVVLTQCVIQIDRLCATVYVQDPLRTPNAIQLDSMTLHSYIEQHAWTAGVCVFGAPNWYILGNLVQYYKRGGKSMHFHEKELP